MAWSDWQSVGTKGVVLWENPNPTASFAGQDIYVTAGYENILVEYLWFNDMEIKRCVYHNTGTAESYLSNGSTNRDLQYVSANGRVLFSDAENNSYMIPTKIIGFKKDIADV